MRPESLVREREGCEEPNSEGCVCTGKGYYLPEEEGIS